MRFGQVVVKFRFFTLAGFAGLAVMIDLHSRRVVG